MTGREECVTSTYCRYAINLYPLLPHFFYAAISILYFCSVSHHYCRRAASFSPLSHCCRHPFVTPAERTTTLVQIWPRLHAGSRSVLGHAPYLQSADHLLHFGPAQVQEALNQVAVDKSRGLLRLPLRVEGPPGGAESREKSIHLKHSVISFTAGGVGVGGGFTGNKYPAPSVKASCKNGTAQEEAKGSPGGSLTGVSRVKRNQSE